jgi:hypothetical protein
MQHEKKNIAPVALAVIAVILVLALLIQLIPCGRNHTNPAVIAEPKWDSPKTKELAQRTCYDCHRNETAWPCYTNIAPFSWLVQNDVDEGRRALNFSEWDRPQRRVDEASRIVLEGEMPLGIYLLMHPSARLSPTEVNQIAQGLVNTIER